MCSYAWISGSARLDKQGMFMKRGTYHTVKRWLPPVCSQAKVIKPDGTEGGNTSKLRLDLCQWQLAWDRHMIGAIVVGQVGLFPCLS